MKSRERVLAALNHKEPDRIPIDLGSTIVSSITKKAYEKLRMYLGLGTDDIRVFDHVQGLPYLHEDILEEFSIDFRMVQLDYVTIKDQEFQEEEGYYHFADRWGAKLKKPKEKGLYFDWLEFPISDEESLMQYKWPEPDSWETIHKLKEKAEHLYNDTSYALVGSAIFGGGIFEQPGRIMGLENFFVNLAWNKSFVEKIMSQIEEIYEENCRRYLKEIGEYIQVFAYWDDLAAQNNLLVSPQDYRKLVKPKQRKLFELIKGMTKAKLFYHSCGTVRELIPDLIEIGVDILNPIQVSSYGMDTLELKKEFGDSITFWGGGCDTQYVLPFGSSKDVRGEVKRRISDLGPGGDFVFCAVHNIQADVPPENVVTMYEAALEFGRYA